MVLWQASHDWLVGMCVEALPLAVVLLWHDVQAAESKFAWSTVALRHAVVRWQPSHEAVVAGCLAGRPLATDPLWQDAHVRSAIPA